MQNSVTLWDFLSIIAQDGAPNSYSQVVSFCKCKSKC